MHIKKWNFYIAFFIAFLVLLSFRVYADYAVIYGNSCSKPHKTYRAGHHYWHWKRGHSSSISVYAVWKNCPSCCCNDWTYNPDLATADDDTVENPDMDIDE